MNFPLLLRLMTIPAALLVAVHFFGCASDSAEPAAKDNPPAVNGDAAQGSSQNKAASQDKSATQGKASNQDKTSAQNKTAAKNKNDADGKNQTGKARKMDMDDMDEANLDENLNDVERREVKKIYDINRRSKARMKKEVFSFD